MQPASNYGSGLISEGGKLLPREVRSSLFLGIMKPGPGHLLSELAPASCTNMAVPSPQRLPQQQVLLASPQIGGLMAPISEESWSISWIAPLVGWLEIMALQWGCKRWVP